MTGDNVARPQRAFGFWICLALVVGNMIGSGIFLLPATLAPFGWNGVAGWIVTTAGAICLAIVFGSLARAFPSAGGPYAYSRRAFGPFPAFVVAWSYWVSMWIGNVAIATGVVAPLSTVFPAITPHSVWITLALVWSLTAINCFGAKTVGRIQLVTTLLKFLPLAAVVLLAILVLGRGGGEAAPPLRIGDLGLGGATGIAAAAALTLWSFLGLESATVPAERVHEPQRNIPRATLIGVAVTGLVYTFAAIAAFGTLNGWVLMQGELPWAMARDGVFPAFLAKLSRFGTPARAHIVASIALSIVLLLNYSRTLPDLFGFLILLATTASLVVYVVCSLAAVRLGTGPKLVPIFLAGAIFSVWAIWGAGYEAMAWGAVLLATGVPLYFLTRRRGSSPAAADGRAGPPESAA